MECAGECDRGDVAGAASTATDGAGAAAEPAAAAATTNGPDSDATCTERAGVTPRAAARLRRTVPWEGTITVAAHGSATGTAGIGIVGVGPTAAACDDEAVNQVAGRRYGARA